MIALGVRKAVTAGAETMEEPSGGSPPAEAEQVNRFTRQAIAARQARVIARVLIACGVFFLLLGGAFFAAKHSGHNVVATVTHAGPCSNGTCTVDVAYDAAGTQYTAVMYGVPSDEIYGPPAHRMLNINYDSPGDTSPTDNDMPDAVWIGFLAGGLAFAGWGAGLRRWGSKEWSPFLLRRVPVGGQAGRKPQAEVWSPLAGSEARWDDVAARVRRAGIVFAGWLAVTAVAAAVTVALYARDLSNPQADYSLAVLALSATGLALVMTCTAWARRRNLEKIERAGTAVPQQALVRGLIAALLAGTRDSTVGSRAVLVRCLKCGAEIALATEVCARCGAPLSYQQRVAADAPDEPPGQRASPGYSKRKILVLAGAGLALVTALITVIAVHSSAQSADQLTWDQLRSGDCLAGSNMGLATGSPWPDYVTSVPCTKQHEAEVFFAGDTWPQSLAYPGGDAVNGRSDARCVTAFAAYDGVDYTVSAFSFTEIVPGSSAWASGDRLLVCLAYEPSSGPSGGTPVDYSIKGSNK
jgi:hypothetical protein